MLVVMLLKKNIYLFIIWHWVLVAAHQIFEFSCHLWDFLGFPDSSFGKESTCNAGDPGSIPGSGRSPGEGKGYLLQYSGLENSTVHGVTKSWTGLSNFRFHFVGSLVATCRIWFPDQGSNVGPLYWEHGVLATWPPRKTPPVVIFDLFYRFIGDPPTTNLQL